jgi:hypothetical protein
MGTEQGDYIIQGWHFVLDLVLLLDPEVVPRVITVWDVQLVAGRL